MKLLTAFLISTGLLLSQTAQFPSSIAGPQQLGVVANGVSGTLNNSLTTSSTSANITNGTCTLGGQATTCSVAFQPYMFVTIQNEIMQVCSLGSSTGVTILNFGILGSSCPSISGRGLDGTQIAAHTSPSFPNTLKVSNNITAWTHMADAAEITAIEQTSVPTVNLRYFGAKFDCVTPIDDTAAWQAALTYLTSVGHIGGTIQLPANSCSKTTTGIVVAPSSGQFIRIVGQGNSSVIQCTGVACVSWNSAAAQGSGMQDVSISDPVGDASTITLYVEGGSNLRFSNMQILGNSSLQSGGHFAGLGIGVYLKNTTLPRFDNVAIGYFNKATFQTGFVNALWTQSYFSASGGIGWDIEATGDNYCIQCDIESNTGVGVYLGVAANKTSIIQSHFEGNLGGHVEIKGTGAQLASEHNDFESGTILADTGGAFVSSVDYMSGTTLTNNSNGGGGVVGATLRDPLLGPTLAGTGCTITDIHGVKKATGAGCSSLNYDLQGYARYTMDANVSTTGTLASSNTGVNTLSGSLFVATITTAINAASECSGAGTGCSGASANNALTVKWLKPDGNPVTLAAGQMFYLSGAAHTLQIGANTLNLNNTGAFPIHTLQKGANLTSTWVNTKYYFIVAASEYLLIGAL